MAIQREDRAAPVETCRSPISSSRTAMTLAPLVVKDKVIVGVGQRRSGRPRVYRRVRRADRAKKRWRFHTDSRTGEPGHESWEPCPPGILAVADAGQLLRSGSVEARRRRDLAHRLLRSRSQPHILGDRQRMAGLQPGPAPRRQPLRRVGRGARCRYGQAPVALSVHAERPDTTTTPCRSPSWPT